MKKKMLKEARRWAKVRQNTPDTLKKDKKDKKYI